MAKEAAGKSRTKNRMFRWGAGMAAVLALVLYTASYILDEPLRRKMEKNINRELKGYTVRLPKLHVQLLDLSLTLQELTVLQQAHPEPPIVYLPVLKASIHWQEILSGKLVAEFNLIRPKININLLQLRSEAASKGSLKERGWQQALEEIYPLKINTVKISDADFTYIDQDPKKPLVLSHLNLRATNIRNIHLPAQVYPSSFHLDTAIFGSGHGSIDGNANFLAEPYPGIKGRLKLENVPLGYFNPVFARSYFSIHGGVLRASGEAEYSPKAKSAHLENLEIQGMKIDYLHSKRTAEAEKQRAAMVRKTARELGNKSDLLIRADQISLTFADTDFHLSNFSNHFSRGPAEAKLKAKFMGSGLTTASANFRAEEKGPDFDIFVKINDTRLTAMNDLLRAYGDFDVSAGVFSLVSELHVKNNAISGYIKPFFKDITVYDRHRDKERGISHQLYEVMIGGVAGLLENRSRQEVATKANITGSLDNPQTSSWGIVAGLIKNAFFKAILPSFENTVSETAKR